MEFLGHGLFEYNIMADVRPTDINQKPPFTGKYKFTKNGGLKVQPVAVHLGSFTVRLSEDKDRLFVKHRFSGRQSVMQKFER